MILKEIINIIEKWAPVKHAEDFDNVGLLVGNPTNSVKKALITGISKKIKYLKLR